MVSTNNVDSVSFFKEMSCSPTMTRNCDDLYESLQQVFTDELHPDLLVLFKLHFLYIGNI